MSDDPHMRSVTLSDQEARTAVDIANAAGHAFAREARNQHASQLVLLDAVTRFVFGAAKSIAVSTGHPEDALLDEILDNIWWRRRMRRGESDS